MWLVVPMHNDVDNFNTYVHITRTWKLPVFNLFLSTHIMTNSLKILNKYFYSIKFLTNLLSIQPNLNNVRKYQAII